MAIEATESLYEENNEAKRPSNARPLTEMRGRNETVLEEPNEGPIYERPVALSFTFECGVDCRKGWCRNSNATLRTRPCGCGERKHGEGRVLRIDLVISKSILQFTFLVQVYISVNSFNIRPAMVVYRYWVSTAKRCRQRMLEKYRNGARRDFPIKKCRGRSTLSACLE